MTIQKFEKACLRGVENAFKQYHKFSGGLSLGTAPEGFIQGEMAKELAKITPYVTLESSVYDTLADAGAERRGKLPGNARGRIDIVTWWKNQTPRVLIEVKKAWGRDSINGDARRLRKVLGRGGSSREGLVVVFSHAAGEKTLKGRFAAIGKRAKAKLSNNTTGPKKFRANWTASNRYWQAACFRVRASG